MKFFKILLILSLGLQIGLLGDSGSGNNDNDVFADYNYYLKYESKSIVNDGECWVCDEVKDGFVAIKESVDTTTGTTYCKVYKTTDISDGAHIGFANRQVKSCAYQNSKTAKEVENYSKTITSKSANQKGITSSLVEKSNNKKITFSKFMVGLLTLNPNIINRKIAY